LRTSGTQKAGGPSNEGGVSGSSNEEMRDGAGQITATFEECRKESSDEVVTGGPKPPWKNGRAGGRRWDVDMANVTGLREVVVDGESGKKYGGGKGLGASWSSVAARPEGEIKGTRSLVECDLSAPWTRRGLGTWKRCLYDGMMSLLDQNDRGRPNFRVLRQRRDKETKERKEQRGP